MPCAPRPRDPASPLGMPGENLTKRAQSKAPSSPPWSALSVAGGGKTPSRRPFLGKDEMGLCVCPMEPSGSA